MKVGDLVKTKDNAPKEYPKGMGIVTRYRDQGLHEMYNSVHVLWPCTGEERSMRQMFLEVVDESR